MNTFKKIGNDWCIHVPTSHDSNGADRTVPGMTVEVQTRAGKRKQVTLGERVATDAWGTVFKTAAPAPRQPATVIGNLSGIMAMFDRARGHLRAPAIALDGFGIRLSVAGDRAREPGSLTVTGSERDTPNRFRDGGLTRAWYGRVTRAGTFEPGRDCPPGIGARLQEFAADPARVAGEQGRLAGRCCFCRKRLGEGRDQRSVAVGYGPDCAEHYGLPWGAEHSFEAAETERDERNKHEARAHMEMG